MSMIELNSVSIIPNLEIEEYQTYSTKRQSSLIDRFSPSKYQTTASRLRRSSIRPITEEGDHLLTLKEAKELTPVKTYPVKTDKDTGQCHIEFTPESQKRLRKSGKQSHKKTEAVFYRFKEKTLSKGDTHKEKKGKVYIGMTVQGLARGLQHSREAMRGSNTAFHQALRDSNREFDFGLYPYKIQDLSKTIETRDSKGKCKQIGVAGRAEQILIQAKKSLVKQGGYNSNRGGAEGRDSKVRRHLDF